MQRVLPPLLLVAGNCTPATGDAAEAALLQVRLQPGLPEAFGGHWDHEHKCRYPGGNPKEMVRTAGARGTLGVCLQNHTTADPRVFGPIFWKAFHIFAQNYPEDPADTTHQACGNFTRAIPFLLPCPHCGHDFSEFIKLNEKHDGCPGVLGDCMGAKGENTCQSPDEACKSRDGLVSFYVRAHNNVNHNAHPCRKRWTVEDARGEYSAFNACLHNIVWGSCQIPKSARDSNQECCDDTSGPDNKRMCCNYPASPNTTCPPAARRGGSRLVVATPSDDSDCTFPGGNPAENISPGTLGKCTLPRTSADPRIFGPWAWPAFHIMAQNYPTDPTPEVRASCVSFIYSIPYMLPCQHCGHDFDDFIQVNVRNAGSETPECAGADGESICTKPEDACSTRESLVSFFVRAHNNVNSHVHPCREKWTIANATYEYTNRSACLHNIIWGSCEIPRNMSDRAGCCSNSGGQKNEDTCCSYPSSPKRPCRWQQQGSSRASK
mmetsp:Transcript_87182/g.241764  ORF Transcript_87182/g.241764 Transcript_87182/m.241764 type:complete len:492 (+) Transcript_87182:50-1525(+)